MVTVLGVLKKCISLNKYFSASKAAKLVNYMLFDRLDINLDVEMAEAVKEDD